MAEQDIAFTPADAPHAWLTPAVARHHLSVHVPVDAGSRSGIQSALIQMLDEVTEDPESWPGWVALIARNGWIWHVAAVVIADGTPVSDEDAHKVGDLRHRGLLR